MMVGINLAGVPAKCMPVIPRHPKHRPSGPRHPLSQHHPPLSLPPSLHPLCRPHVHPYLSDGVSEHVVHRGGQKKKQRTTPPHQTFTTRPNSSVGTSLHFNQLVITIIIIIKALIASKMYTYKHTCCRSINSVSKIFIDEFRCEGLANFLMFFFASSAS